MKSSGLTRKIDSLGRVVVPIELRRFHEIEIGDTVEVFNSQEGIVLRKYIPNGTCLVTGVNAIDNVSVANGKIILSRSVAKDIANELLETLGEEDAQ